MQVTKTETDTRTYQLDIEVDASTVSKAFGRAYKDFSRFTRVPGFRPGHAPRKVLERYVDHERLRRYVMESLAADAYAEAIKSEGLDPYGEPDIVPGDLVDGEPWRFQVTVADQPRVELGDYSDLSVERPIVPVTDEDVERAIDSIRQDRAELRSVQGRAVQPDDVLIVDMSITPEGEPPGEVGRSIVRLHQAIPGFAEAVTGQMIDETREFTLTFPPDYSDPQRAGVTARFSVTVASISERVLPEVTDEWVKTISPHDTVEGWKAAIREDLESRMRAMADDHAMNQIVKQLVERSTVEYAPAMLHEEVERDLQSLAADLSRNGTSYEQYLSMVNMSREEHQARLEAEADATIRTRLVLRAFAAKEGIVIKSEEIEARYSEIQASANAAGIRLAGSERDQRNRLANRILMDRLRERLMSLAQITDVPLAPGAEGA